MGSLNAKGQVVAEDTRSIVIVPRLENADGSRDSDVTLENVSDPMEDEVKLAVLLVARQNVALFRVSGISMAPFKLRPNDPRYAADRAELQAWHPEPGKEWHPYRIPRTRLGSSSTFSTKFKVAPRLDGYQHIRWAVVYASHRYDDGLTFFGETDLPPRPSAPGATRPAKPYRRAPAPKRGAAARSAKKRPSRGRGR